MPPRQSELLTNQFGGGKTWRTDSKIYKEYKAKVLTWTLTRAVKIKEIRELLEYEMQPQRLQLVVDSYFGMTPADYWFKNGTVRNLDATNYIKALHDSLVNVLGVDDRYYAVGACEKVLLPKTCQEGERTVLLRLRLQGIKNLHDISEIFGQDLTK